MRLYDTLTRSKRELPPPPGPVRMYFCGPTVYARAHIGNARPFVLGMWLRSWLRERGYDVTLVHNITDINDKIYAAAPGASAQLAEEATRWYLEDTGDLGLGMADETPRATDYVPQIVASSRRWSRAGSPIRPAETCTSASLASPTTAACRAGTTTRTRCATRRRRRSRTS